MHDDLLTILLHKQLTNQLDETDKKILFDWLVNSTDNKEQLDEMAEIWSLSKNYKPEFKPDVNKGFEKFYARINASDSDNGLKVASKKKNYSSWIAVLVSLLIIVSAVFFFSTYFNSNSNQLLSSTIAGEVNEISLSDGSRVWINEKSVLSYPSKFKGDSRLVSLKGEGFFEIEPNSRKPFIIDADGLNVKVIGTSFSINTLNSKGNIEVEVKSGTVELYIEGSEEKLVLTKLEKAEYNPNTMMFSTKILLDSTSIDSFLLDI